MKKLLIAALLTVAGSVIAATRTEYVDRPYPVPVSVNKPCLMTVGEHLIINVNTVIRVEYGKYRDFEDKVTLFTFFTGSRYVQGNQVPLYLAAVEACSK